MTKLISVAILVLAAIAITSCTKPPTGETTPIGEFRVEHLFDNDGCSVYRFYDAGRDRYYAKCTNATSSNTISSYHSGKNSTTDELVSTGYVEKQ